MNPRLDNEEATLLARELAELTEESMEQAIVVAIRERLIRERRKRHRARARRESATVPKVVPERVAPCQVFDDRAPPEPPRFDSLFFEMD